MSSIRFKIFTPPLNQGVCLPANLSEQYRRLLPPLNQNHEYRGALKHNRNTVDMQWKHNCISMYFYCISTMFLSLIYLKLVSLLFSPDVNYSGSLEHLYFHHKAFAIFLLFRKTFRKFFAEYRFFGQHNLHTFFQVLLF